MSDFQLNTIYNEDCIETMKRIPDNFVDCIITDPPYGLTASDWDTNIDIDKWWEQVLRITKEEAPIVIFGQQPFSSKLILSNLDLYRYSWYWEKDNGTNFLSVKYQPFRVIEEILIFGKLGTTFNEKGNLKYYPQMLKGKPYKQFSGKQTDNSAIVRKGSRENVTGYLTENEGNRYPKNIIQFNRDGEKLHPTQKPLKLMQYLVNTYSLKDDIIYDSYSGSGTTAVACHNLGRKYICSELNKDYCEIAESRLRQGVLL